jgi:hypothetical protein
VEVSTLSNSCRIIDCAIDAVDSNKGFMESAWRSLDDVCKKAEADFASLCTTSIQSDAGRLTMYDGTVTSSHMFEAFSSIVENRESKRKL